MIQEKIIEIEIEL